MREIMNNMIGGTKVWKFGTLSRGEHDSIRIDLISLIDKFKYL